MLERHSLYKLTLYIIGFLLFCEWLRPMDSISHTNDVKVFFVYATFCFFVSFLQIQWWLSIPLKGLGMAFIIDGLYIAERIFSRDWFSVIYEQIVFNIQMIQGQEWWQMTPMFRSLLFLILLWLMSYLLYYWFVVARRMFIFVLLTLVFVTVTDTFTVYDGKWAIVRTFVLGMIALGLSSFAKEMEKESISFRGLHKAQVWALPLLAIILFSSAAAYASPKLAPQWPDPVPYLESATGGSGPGGSGHTQKVGYGENDSRLGGSFVQDDTRVFRATADGDRYWRIESKDTYTGKGWEDTLEEPVASMDPDNITYETFTDEVEVEEQRAMIQMTNNASFRKLVYPYGLSSLLEYPANYELRVHENTGEMDTIKGDSPAKVNTYVLNYDFPSFEYDQLREADAEDPAEIREKYLQLPDDLPNRVRNLASQIVEEEDNRYDRAKAVESYFSSNGFEYSTTDVPVPEENEDYVDQFLFDSQIGYCDNFSTSMVVLLRSEGIPARWVKGFTSGERIDAQENPYSDEVQNVYEVTSGNAHSWVEVYFPEVGWVPFEPTKGFTNNADFYSDIDSEAGEDANATPEEENTPEDNLGNPQQQMEEEQESGDAGVGGSSDKSYTWLWITLTAILVTAVLLYITRFRWMSALLIRRYRKNKDEDTYEKAYQYLLKLLAHKGLKRKPEQTLRDYAGTVDRHFQTNEMRRLTNHYERLVYRNESQSSQWPKVTELWENLIKKALS
ncbi:transglutaminase TgpA family protein [Halobacillus litoralis]|uniref:Peptidase n=1 Tax=Halobacillus litoralis TaxID=45668 RepID=A0A410MBS0_9BACI|nr:transglutaminaseTgpA domain-containing protein [Halobacillus litoralis]QAS52147.1 peptidase [Halobacillus litoralis]